MLFTKKAQWVLGIALFLCLYTNFMVVLGLFIIAMVFVVACTLIFANVQAMRICLASWKARLQGS